MGQILKNEMFPSPYVARLHAMWAQFREVVIQNFPAPPGLPEDKNAYMKAITEIYAQDAYNSLSIEGYRVTDGLIAKVRRAEWNPDLNCEDKERHNALAARGYYEARLQVEQSVRKILDGENPGMQIANDLQQWYQSMFSPVVRAGILSASDLFGYRRGQVYLRGSRHTPPAHEYVKECMDAFFDLLIAEPHAGVRALLGHFFFVYIHPYMDGNGRIARFLMNAMFASGGYPWTIIHVANRDRYMSALESASVGGDILPFTRFVAYEVG